MITVLVLAWHVIGVGFGWWLGLALQRRPPQVRGVLLPPPKLPSQRQPHGEHRA